MVFVPPIKSGLNALLGCISLCFLQEGQGHVKICLFHPVFPKIAGQCSYFTVCHLFGLKFCS